MCSRKLLYPQPYSSCMSNVASQIRADLAFWRIGVSGFTQNLPFRLAVSFRGILNFLPISLRTEQSSCYRIMQKNPNEGLNKCILHPLERNSFPTEPQSLQPHLSHSRSPASATKPVAALPLGCEFGNIPLMFFFFCRLRNLALELVD